MNTPASGPSRKALGRGLDSLLKKAPAKPGAPAASAKPTPAAAAAAPAPAPPSAPEGSLVEQIALDRIVPNPLQPRRHFSEEALEELAASIREHGILNPVILRKQASGPLQLIAGERRFRAAARAGLKTIPAIVRTLHDEEALELTIIENLQREDLNPMEQARAFQELATRFRLTQEQIAQRTGKERSSVANFLRLLKLDPEVQQRVEAGALSMGHARALLSLDPEAQRRLSEKIAEQGWSVRQVEERVAAAGQVREPQPPKPRDPNVRDAEEELCRQLGTKVRIKDGKRNRGTIEIDYFGLEEFQRLYEKFTS